MGYTNASIHSFPFPFPFHEVLVSLQSAWEKKKKKKSGVHAFRICSAVSELIDCELPPQMPPQISPQGAHYHVHGTTIHYRWHIWSPRTVNTANFTILLEFPCPGGKIMHNWPTPLHYATATSIHEHSFRVITPVSSLSSRFAAATHMELQKLNQHPSYTPTFTGVGSVGAVVDYDIGIDQACARAGWKYSFYDMWVFFACINCFEMQAHGLRGGTPKISSRWC